MRRVLVLTSHHPSRRDPSRALYGYYTYRALARHAELRLLSPRPFWTRLRWPRELLRAPRERWDEFDVEVPAFVSLPGVPALHALGMAATLAPRVAALRREFAFEAILGAWAYPDGVAAAALAAIHRVPLVLTVLGSDVNELARRASLAPQIRLGLSRARRVVAVSDALGREVVRLGVPRERVEVLHNGVDGEVFRLRDRRQARAALGLDPATPLAGYVGNLAREKGADVLVEAAALLRARTPRPVDVVLVGAGALEPELRARVASLGLDGRVRLVGRRLHDEVPLWLAAFDVLCLPSRREGCPNVVLEALASGRPVVASAVGGVPELVREGAGLLVPPERPDALASAIAAALARTWDDAALRATVPSLSWDAVAAAYARLVDEVVAEAS
jgi:glycosyltransferase involved in cell wall biosynthesis